MRLLRSYATLACCCVLLVAAVALYVWLREPLLVLAAVLVVLSPAAMLPQITSLWRSATKNTEAIDLRMFALFVMGNLCGALLALHSGAWALLTANIINIVLLLVAVALVEHYRARYGVAGICFSPAPAA